MILPWADSEPMIDFEHRQANSRKDPRSIKTAAQSVYFHFQKASLESKTSVFLHVPQARNAIVGQVTEFKWEYRLSDADSKDVKALQLSQSSNPQTKQLVLWKAQNNVNTTNPKYAKRLLATKNKRHNSRTLSYSFKLFNVTLNDEGNFTFKVEFGNQLRNVKRRVFLDVQGAVVCI